MMHKYSKYITGTFLMTAVMGANVLNLLFNIYLGRTINSIEFGVIILITNFLYIGGMVLNALSSTINREVSIRTREGNSSGSFINSLFLKILKLTVPLSIAWILLSPFIARFFHLENVAIILLFAPVILLAPYLWGGRGYFNGKFAFLTAAILIVIEPLIKLLVAAILITLNLHEYLYLSVHLSVLFAGVIAIIFIYKSKSKGIQAQIKFPRKFFFNAVLVGASSMAFLSLDVILAKHFLSPQLAGEYALLSLVGKMVFFLGTLLNVFTISIVSRDLGNRKNPRISFYRLLSGAVFLCAIGFLGFGLLGNISLPILFGEKSQPIIGFVIPYILAIVLFTVASITTSYHLVKKQYIFSWISVISAPLLILGITLFHANIMQIVNVMLFVSLINFLVIGFLHIKNDVLGTFDIDRLLEKEAISL